MKRQHSFMPRKKDLSEGTYSPTGELLDYTYYDSFGLNHTIQSYNLFQQAQGQGISATTSTGTAAVKNIADTNMTQGGQLPRGQRLTVRNLKILLNFQSTTGSPAAMVTTDIAKLYHFLSETVLEFKITGKDSLFVYTLQELLGTSVLTALVPTVSGDNIPLIQPRFHGIFPLNKPIILAEQTNFSVPVTVANASDASIDGLVVKVGLNGILERRS